MKIQLMTNQKLWRIQVDFFIAIVFLLQCIFSDFLNEDFLKFQIVVYIFFVVFNIRTKLKNFSHPYFTFLLTFFVFLYSRVFLDLLGFDSFATTDFFTAYQFSADIQIQMLLILLIALNFINMGFNISILFLSQDDFSTIDPDLKLQSFTKIIMKISFLFCIIAYWQVWQNVLDYGYLYLYSENYEKPGLLRFVTILNLSYYFFLASIPEMKNFRKYTIPYFLLLLLGLLTGQRGPFVVGILVIFVFYNNFIKKVNLKIIMTLALSLILMTQMAFNLRTDSENNVGFGFIGDFLYNQGISISIVGYTLQFDNDLDEMGLNKIFYPFTEFLDEIKGEPKDLNREKELYFPSKLSYLANDKYYYMGFGMGSSFIAELYSSLGMIGMAVACFFIGFLIDFSFFKLKHNRIGIVLLLYLWGHLFWMSRASLLGIFPVLINQSKNIIIFLILFKIYKSLKFKGDCTDE